MNNVSNINIIQLKLRTRIYSVPTPPTLSPPCSLPSHICTSSLPPSYDLSSPEPQWTPRDSSALPSLSNRNTQNSRSPSSTLLATDFWLPPALKNIFQRILSCRQECWKALIWSAAFLQAHEGETMAWRSYFEAIVMGFIQGSFSIWIRFFLSSLSFEFFRRAFYFFFRFMCSSPPAVCAFGFFPCTGWNYFSATMCLAFSSQAVPEFPLCPTVLLIWGEA